MNASPGILPDLINEGYIEYSRICVDIEKRKSVPIYEIGCPQGSIATKFFITTCVHVLIMTLMFLF